MEKHALYPQYIEMALKYNSRNFLLFELTGINRLKRGMRRQV